MQSEHIEHRVGAAGFPHAYIGKSRIRVSTVAVMYQTMLDELLVERFLEDFPTLSAEQLMAAFRYWREHPDEIAEDIRRDDEALESLKHTG